MKKIAFYSFIILFLGCDKDKGHTGRPTRFIFYQPNSIANYSVILNGVDVGKVPYTAGQAPPCENNVSFGLIKDVTAGTYTVDFKSLDGYAWGNPVKYTIQAGQCLQIKH